MSSLLERLQESASPITLNGFLKWIALQRGTIDSPIRSYCETLFHDRVSGIRVWPEEIRVSYRYAYSDTYTPDADLAEMIRKLSVKRYWTAEEISATREARAAA